MAIGRDFMEVTHEKNLLGVEMKCNEDGPSHFLEEAAEKHQKASLRFEQFEWHSNNPSSQTEANDDFHPRKVASPSPDMPITIETAAPPSSTKHRSSSPHPSLPPAETTSLLSSATPPTTHTTSESDQENDSSASIIICGCPYI